MSNKHNYESKTIQVHTDQELSSSTIVARGIPIHFTHSDTKTNIKTIREKKPTTLKERNPDW